MDPANTPLGTMILDEITPVVMVLSTPLVEEACLKNGLSFVEMLTPFSSFTNIDVPVRTSSDQPYRVQKFNLRLFYDSDIRQPNLEIAKERLKQVLTEVGEKENFELCSEPSHINDLLACSESEVLPTWFNFFNKELVRTVSFSDHEAFDHPVACLLVVSSKDEQPINRFVDLFNTNKLPSLLNDGAMDPKILKHYIVVHDNQEGSSESVAKILTEMKNTFGPNDCHVLCMNSSEDGPREHENNPWTVCKSGDAPNQRLGCFLNMDDMKEIKDLMQELSSKRIIPYMELKVRMLNQQVSTTRKGFRNQIKNLWWRKGKEDAPDSSNGPTYTFSSIESQIRVLGDHAFMLRDYELALSSYRLISTDYKLDKAWKRYAGVQEMMGLAYFISDQSRKEAEYCMENAFSTYLKIGSSAQQNATRCGLWWVEMLKAWGHYKEAATVYFRICSEELLHSAVMLEQASYCYLLCQPPMLHKYGFHLVLSGDRYKRCDQIKHAIRTYRSAIPVYKGTTWNYIKDHVHFHIGQWYSFLGMYDVAVTHMLEILACSHQSNTTQELFLRNFLQIVQKAGKTFDVLKLQLPVINTNSLKVIFEDHRTYGSPAAASIKESLWHSLEEELTPSLSTSRTNWLELQSKVLPRRYKQSNICVAGEAVKVDIEFKNPLQIPISVSGVSLMCELVPNSELNSDGDATSSSTDIREDAEGKVGNTELDSSLTMSEIEFSLEGGETYLAQLTVTPMVEGVLTIVGIKWKLSGSVVGFYNFKPDLLKKASLKGRKKTKHPPGSELKFMVIKRLPKLEGVISGLPKMAYAGELSQLVLELKNQSESSVKNLKMKISHPRFLLVGNQEDLSTGIHACLEKNRNGEQNEKYDPNKVPDSLFQFPQDISVHGEKPVMWPLWFRAAVPGNISLYAVIYYEIDDVSNEMRYRTLRLHYTLQVLPSLNVSFKITPSPSRLREFLVAMDIVNKTSSEVFQLNQLSCVGKEWEILLLQPVHAMFPSRTLSGGQAVSCFFILKRLLTSASDENGEQTGDHHPHLRNELSLAPEDSKEVLLDVLGTPLVDFHHCERLQNKTSNQEDGSTAEFILIYQTPKLDSEVSDMPNFFSHHACHCSTESYGPISSVLSGPQITYHNFSTSFCQIKLQMTIYNSSELAAFVSIDTHNYTGASSQISEATSATTGNQSGWYDVPQITEIKVTTDVHVTGIGKSASIECVPPFIWSGTCSNKFQLDPLSSTEIPMQVCIFSPGTYDLSNYVLNWNLQSANDQENKDKMCQLSGSKPGYSYFLTVLQSVQG